MLDNIQKLEIIHLELYIEEGMILNMNLEKSKQEFMKYVEKLDRTKPSMERKIWHSIRVMENSKKIAESLKLGKEEIYVASIIGLLHDIGKLKQKNDEMYKNREHGEFGVEILKQGDYIRKYIEDNKYDEIIFKAIKNHGIFAIEDGLSEKESMFAKIVRDADKLDIFYEGAEIFWNTDEEREKIGLSNISEYVLNKFKENKTISKENRGTLLDGIVGFISFIFDINFKYDFVILKQEDYVNKIIDKFNFENEETRKQMEEIRKIANEYIERK